MLPARRDAVQATGDFKRAVDLTAHTVDARIHVKASAWHNATAVAPAPAAPSSNQATGGASPSVISNQARALSQRRRTVRSLTPRSEAISNSS